MRFIGKSDVRARLEGRRVCIVGSGPGVLDNAPGFIDRHDVVVRVNNYKLSAATGQRTDVHYSFYGNSIRKPTAELKRDGVTLCMCKCPNALAIDSPWHRRHGKMTGVDFRWIYQKRSAFWFCDTYVPELSDFLATFNLLGWHVPTTGFSAILDVLACDPASLHLTGFDFFKSGIHNVNERWSERNLDDPIGHVPERECAWLAANMSRYPITVDAALARAMDKVAA
jgi:hypothetical protein